MEPVQHPLCTATIGAPSDMQDGSCNSLPVAYTKDEYGTWAISFWKPEADELAALLHGAHVALHVRTPLDKHPVIGLGAFVSANDVPSPQAACLLQMQNAAIDLAQKLTRAEGALKRAGFCDAGGIDWEPPIGARWRSAACDVLAERRRQEEQEGWTTDSDDRRRRGELTVAGACYAALARAYPIQGSPPPSWPWSPDWWKPKDDRSNLVRAAALIIAEIERIDRADRTTGA